MTPLPVISVPRKPLNCCHAIIGSPACMHLSNRTSLPATPAPVANHLVTFNMVNSRRCQPRPVRGNRYLAISSPTSRSLMGMTPSSCLSIASRRCVTSCPVSKQPMRLSSLACSLITSSAYTASPNRSFPTADRSSRLIFGVLSHP